METYIDLLLLYMHAHVPLKDERASLSGKEVHVYDGHFQRCIVFKILLNLWNLYEHQMAAISMSG